jgi:hypothetical protein
MHENSHHEGEECYLVEIHYFATLDGTSANLPGFERTGIERKDDFAWFSSFLAYSTLC